MTVLLVGDSHAEHWAPALVRAGHDHDWRLLSLTRAKCMPYDFNAVRPQDHGTPTVGEICQHWKRIAYPAVIARYDPDLVIVGGRPQIYDVRSEGQVIGRSTSGWMPAFRDSWRWMVRVLTAGGAKLGALTLQPTFPSRVPDCLDRYGLRTERCDMRLGDDPNTAQPNSFILRLHRAYDRVWPVPVTSLLCPHHMCRAVIRHHITHVDESHITRHFSHLLAGAVFKLLASKRLLSP